MSCEDVSLELRYKTIVKLSAVRTNDGILFQTMGRTDEQQSYFLVPKPV